MNKEEWQEVEAIVDKALALNDAQQRAFINQSCEDNKELKSRVITLLQSIEKSEGYLEDSSSDLSSYFRDLPSDISFNEESPLIGQKIGAYRITQLIGYGGMGSVFKAERADGSFDHTVALKIIRRGMNTPSNVARFKREQQILAGLNHPNIARLYDGGVTAEGLPYLIMEYIDGQPVTEYCDNHRLTIKERINLFCRICDTVQFAHRNLVIHRDLKPANILINKNGEVKILDFGIAKLLDEGQQRHTLTTGNRMLTPAYAAPEQLLDQPVTTSTDGYALGVLFYKLVCGTAYLDLKGKSVTTMESVIKKQTPSAINHRYGSLSHTKQLKIAFHRNTTPTELNRYLNSDLNAILQKQLRKEPQKRYESVSHLAEELQRYLGGHPVQAHKGSLKYYTAKFIKRNKVAVSAALIFLMTVSGFTAFYTWRISDERNKVTLQAQKLNQVSNFLIDLFSASDPSQSLGDTLTVNVLLTRGLDKIDQLDHQPKIKSQMLNTMGKVYTNLGQYEKAEKLLNQALSLLKNNDGSDREMATVYNDLGVLNHKAREYTKAERLYKKALQLREHALPAFHADYAQTLSDLGALMRATDRLDSAQVLSQKAYQIRRNASNINRLDVATSLNNLAVLANGQGELDKAESYYQEALSIRKKELGDIHPKIANTLNNIGVLLRDKGQFEKAVPYYQKALDMRVELFGLDHPETAQILNNYAGLLLQMDKLKQAIHYYQQALEIRIKIFGPGAIKVANSYNNLSNALFKKGLFKEAEANYRKAINIYADVLGDDHRYVGIVQSNLGKVLTARDDFKKAGKVFESARSILLNSYSSEHISIANLYRYMAELKIKTGQTDQAIILLEKALKIQRKLQGADHPDIKETVQKLKKLRQARTF